MSDKSLKNTQQQRLEPSRTCFHFTNGSDALTNGFIKVKNHLLIFIEWWEAICLQELFVLPGCVAKVDPSKRHFSTSYLQKKRGEQQQNIWHV